jgi:lantibiotic biosynthesis protein
MSNWVPLLEGDLADSAEQAVLRIAEDLESSNSLKRPQGSEERYPYSLGYGSAGIALFFAYLSLGYGVVGAEAQSRKLMLESINGLMQSTMAPGLFHGFAGIGWVIAHLRDPSIVSDEGSDPFLEIDDSLLRWSGMTEVASELLKGRSGILVYALERHNLAPADEIVSRVLGDLERDAVKCDGGRAWPVSRGIRSHYTFYNSRIGKQVDEHGIYGTSVSHGVTGIIGAIATASRITSDRAVGKGLVEDSVNWLMHHRRSPDNLDDFFETFPTMVGAYAPRLTTGWCNGDVGISLVLLNTAIQLNHPDLREASLAIARKEATKHIDSVETANQLNYCLCHGSCGRIHAFNRLFQLTGDEQFADAARYWTQFTLSLMHPYGGIGGFWLDEPLDGGIKPATGLLTGAAGLGLVLLAATTKVEPQWDRAILWSF